MFVSPVQKKGCRKYVKNSKIHNVIITDCKKLKYITLGWYPNGVISTLNFIKNIFLAASLRQHSQVAWRFTKKRPIILRSNVDQRLNIFRNLHLNFTSTSQLHVVYTKTVSVRRVCRTSIKQKITSITWQSGMAFFFNVRMPISRMELLTE